MSGHVYDAGPELQQQGVNKYIVFVDTPSNIKHNAFSQCCFTVTRIKPTFSKRLVFDGMYLRYKGV